MGDPPATQQAHLNRKGHDVTGGGLQRIPALFPFLELQSVL